MVNVSKAVTSTTTPPQHLNINQQQNSGTENGRLKETPSTTSLSSSFKNEPAFFIRQTSNGCLTLNEQHKDEELEKVQEIISCPVVLTDDRHKGVLMNRLTTLRRNKEFCDVVLYAGDKEIFCHKVILAALSPCFYELFNTSPSYYNNPSQNDIASITRDNHESATKAKSDAFNFENTNKINSSCSLKFGENIINGGRVNLPALSEGCQTVTSSLLSDRLSYYEMTDIDYDSLEAIVNFAYSGSLQISSDRVAQLYKAASALRVQTCVQACALYLTKMLSVKNCIGLRRCANRTNDSLLGNQIDLFIQKNFSEIICNSDEFTSLPCIQVDIFFGVDDKTKFKKDRKLGEKVMDWLQRETSNLPEHVEFRMELLTGRPYMLYLDAEASLQDCNDLDENSSVGSCDLVQDYKKQNRIYPKKSKSSLTHVNGHSNNVAINGSNFQHAIVVSTTSNSKMFRVSSTESMNSFASDLEEFEWKLIAISKNSENYYVMLSIVKRKLAVISVHVNDAPFLKPGLSERLSLMLSKCGDVVDSSDALLATMTDQRCNIGAVFLNNHLVVCGGNNRGECLKSVERFDFNANKWISLAPMLKERARFGACVCDGKIYAVGGSDGSSDLNTCECYDPSTNSWTKLADFDTPRSNNMVASVGHCIYGIGGWNGQTADRMCDSYDPVQNAWEPIAPLTIGRYQAGCCSWNAKIIVVGGCDTWSCISSAEIYDPVHNTWRNLPSMIGARRGCGAAVMNNKLYVAGGSDGSQTLCTVEVLDLSKPHSSWRPGPPLNVPRGNVRLVAADCRIYAVGGFSGKLFSNTIEYLDESASEWRTTVASYSTVLSSISPTHSVSLLGAKSTICEDPIGEILSNSADE